MGEPIVIDPMLIAVISVLITIIGILILAVAHMHMTEIKRQFLEIKNLIENHGAAIDHTHNRITDHVVEFHTVKRASE